ncbi:hypothetical protein B0H14DRAFT_2642507 [Mycena olivaceomarginata]|nr:hypothetical protein B0H14DRAFT_2642507 [Mycena olivaceomarginata]
MIIFIPVPKFLDEESPLHHKVIVLLHDPHNHPVHPKTKPSANDRHTLGNTVQAAGVIGLTVQKLLNAPSTLLVYNGGRVAESSPAYMDTRKVRDFIVEKKKKDYPYGMGWEGITFASLFCDMKTHEAFTQVFTELFDTIAQVTDEKCCIIMMDGEVLQAQGLGHFLVTYNDPEYFDRLL